MTNTHKPEIRKECGNITTIYCFLALCSNFYGKEKIMRFNRCCSLEIQAITLV